MILYKHDQTGITVTNVPHWENAGNRHGEEEPAYAAKYNGSRYLLFHKVPEALKDTDSIALTEEADQIIDFQNGPFGEGVNGVTVEAVLSVCRDRLQHLNNKKASVYTEQAIRDISSALGQCLLRVEDSKLF